MKIRFALSEQIINNESLDLFSQLVEELMRMCSVDEDVVITRNSFDSKTIQDFPERIRIHTWPYFNLSEMTARIRHPEYLCGVPNDNHTNLDFKGPLNEHPDLLFTLFEPYNSQALIQVFRRTKGELDIVLFWDAMYNLKNGNACKVAKNVFCLFAEKAKTETIFKKNSTFIETRIAKAKSEREIAKQNYQLHSDAVMEWKRVLNENTRLLGELEAQLAVCLAEERLIEVEKLRSEANEIERTAKEKVEKLRTLALHLETISKGGTE